MGPCGSRRNSIRMENKCRHVAIEKNQHLRGRRSNLTFSDSWWNSGDYEDDFIPHSLSLHSFRQELKKQLRRVNETMHPLLTHNTYLSLGLTRIRFSTERRADHLPRQCSFVSSESLPDRVYAPLSARNRTTSFRI